VHNVRRLNQHINFTILDPKKTKPNMDGGDTEKGGEESAALLAKKKRLNKELKQKMQEVFNNIINVK
jgi:hypothetical protein